MSAASTRVLRGNRDAVLTKIAQERVKREAAGDDPDASSSEDEDFTVEGADDVASDEDAGEGGHAGLDAVDGTEASDLASDFSAAYGAATATAKGDSSGNGSALSKTQLDSLWAEMNAADSVRRVDHIASALRTSDSASFSSMGSKRGRILIPGAGRYIIDADGLACASNSTRRAVRSSDVYAPFQSKPASASGAGPLFHSHPHSSPALRLSSVTLGGLLSGRKRPRPGSNGAVRGGGEAAAAPVADAPASRDALFDPMLCSILLRGTATASSLSVPLSISSTEASSALHSNGGCLSAAPPPSSSSSSVVSSSSSTGSSSIYFSDGDPAPSLSSNGTDAAPDARSTAKAALLAVAAAAKARAAGSKLAITQTVKFAGQTMRVTKLVEAGTAAAKAATADAEAARARAAIAGPGTDFAPTSTLSRATVMAASSSSSVAPSSSSSSLSSSSALSSQGGVLTEQHQLAASTTTRQEGQLSSTVVHPQSISTFADAHPPQPSLHGAAASAAAAAAGSISLDAIISNLDKPEAISTLTKSSLDWDTYKHSHGLGDELERATKAGFVEKQAFLSRVDERKFELEREERARDRSRREAEAAAAARR